jgi:hypothetical protein
LLDEPPAPPLPEAVELVELLDAAEAKASAAADSWVGSMLKLSNGMPLANVLLELTELVVEADDVASVPVVAEDWLASKAPFIIAAIKA